MKVQLLRQRGERCKGFAYFLKRGQTKQLHTHRRQMTVADVDPVALCTHSHRRLLDSCAFELAENLDCLLLDLFFFALDERQYVVADSKGSHPRIAGAGQRLHCGSDHTADTKLCMKRSERERQHDR